MQRAAFLAVLGALATLALTAHAQSQRPQKQAAQGQAAKPAQAQAQARPQRLGESQGWTAYSAPEKNGQICYLVGQPAKSEPSGVKRDPHLLVTHNTGDKSSNVVSFIAGYGFKDGSSAALDVGGRKFDLFTKDDTAWARDAVNDKAIVDAMTKAKQAVIKGSPAKGAATTDTYSLAGFAQAIAQIDKACRIKR